MKFKVLAACIVAALATFDTQASDAERTVLVTTCEDHGTGSLRAALQTAQDGDSIDVMHLACSEIALTTGAIAVAPARDIRVLGPGADRLAINGGGLGRVLSQAAAVGSLHLSGMTLRNGTAGSGGGCVFTQGDLELSDVWIRDCHVHAVMDALGGAVSTWGNLYADHSRIFDSDATSDEGTAKGGGMYSGGHLLLTYTTVSGNHVERMNTAPFATATGGGISTVSYALIGASTISDNTAEFAGGIRIEGASSTQSLVLDSTVSGNRAGFVGGIHVDRQLELSNSTVAFNCAGRAVFNAAGIGLSASNVNPTLQSSIVAQNGLCVSTVKTTDGAADMTWDVAPPIGGSVLGTANLIGTSTGGVPDDTLLGVDPKLAPLADNGGPTLTHALLADSPAIDAGKNLHHLGIDQRGYGFARASGAAPDIGAFEYQDTIFTAGFEGPAMPNGRLSLAAPAVR